LNNLILKDIKSWLIPLFFFALPLHSLISSYILLILAIISLFFILKYGPKYQSIHHKFYLLLLVAYYFSELVIDIIINFDLYVFTRIEKHAILFVFPFIYLSIRGFNKKSFLTSICLFTGSLLIIMISSEIKTIIQLWINNDPFPNSLAGNILLII